MFAREVRVAAAAGTVFLLVAACSGCGRPAPSPTTARFSSGGISFAYPAGWALLPQDVQRHYEHVLGLLGTGQMAEACPSDAQPGQFNTCTEQLALTPDTIVVKVSSDQFPTPGGMTPVQYELRANPSAAPTTVGGQPAALERPMATFGADEVLLWTIQDPAATWASYAIWAWVRGPHVDGLRAELDALVASVSIAPASP